MAFMASFLVCRYGTMRDNVINLRVLLPYIKNTLYYFHTQIVNFLGTCRLFCQMVMLSRQAPGLERVQLGMQDTLLIVRMTLFCFVFSKWILFSLLSASYIHICVIYIWCPIPATCHRFLQLCLPLPCWMSGMTLLVWSLGVKELWV